ncbi:MAG: DUF255 domain-containing protein [Euryarchaeota archaeon]|nr:DUF255 domain-containing protein [Euryarchaeota archaeon]
MDRTRAMALAILLSASGLALPQPAAAATSITWHDFEEGMNLSLNKRVPALVDFYTDWCTWCKEMDKNTYSDDRVIDRTDGLVCIKVDGDARPDLVARFKVDGYPTTVFLNPDGSEKHRVVGYKAPDDFLKEIDYALDRGPLPATSDTGPCTFALLPLLLLPAIAAVGWRAAGR